MQPTSLLATQFLERLNENDNIGIQLSLAFKVFKFPDLPLVRKEELILNWLVETIRLKYKNTDEKLVDLFVFLKNCLDCPQIKLDQVEIRPSICDGLLEIINRWGFCSDSCLVRKYSQDCVILMLESPICIRYFKQDVMAFSKLVSAFFSSVKTTTEVDGCLTVARALIQIYQQTLSKNGLQLQFSKKLMVAMVHALVSLGETKDSDFEKEIDKCICQILFAQTSAEAYIKGVREPATSEENIEQGSVIMQRILKLPKKCSPGILEHLYPKVFSGFVKFTKDNNLIFEMFATLSAVIGVIPDKECVSTTIKAAKNFDGYNVLLEMLSVIRKSNVSLDGEVNGVYFSSWLISLLETFATYEILSVTNLKIIREIFFLLDPIVVEQMFPHFVTNVMLKTKTSIIQRDIYCETFNEILRVFNRLSRIRKFTSKLLEETCENLEKAGDIDLTLDEILPENLCTKFSEAIVTQPTMVSLQVLTALRYYFEKVVLPKTEMSSFPANNGELIVVEMVFELSSRLLCSTSIADHSVPQAIKEKFTAMLECLSECLQRFGKSLLNNKFNARAIKAFLGLSYSWGALNLLMTTYSYDDNDFIQEQTNTNATNLAYILHFLPDDEWVLLANRVLKFGNDEVKHALFTLMMQKIGALRDKEEGYDGPASQTARFLVEHADSDWVCDHANSLLLSLGPEEVIDFSERLSGCEDQKKLITLFETIEFQESRDMVTAMSMTLLSQIGHECHESGLCLLKDILVYKADETGSEVLDELAVILSEKIKSKKKLGIKKCPITSIIERKLELLSALPLSYLQSHTQVKILLALFAAVQCLPYSTMLFDIITSILDNESPIQLPESINCPSLLQWTVSISKEYPHRSTLIKCLVKACIHCSRTIPTTIHAVTKSPSEENLIISTVISQILPKIIRKKRDVTGDLKDSIQNCENELQTCLSNVANMKPALCWLPTFRMAIHYQLKSSIDDKNNALEQLTKLIPIYVDITLNHVMAETESENLEEEGDFLQMVLKNRKRLQYSLPENILGTFWTKMAGRLPIQYLQTILQAATMEQFTSILASLDHYTTDLLNSSATKSKVFLLWRVLVITYLSCEKETARHKALNKFSNTVLQLTFEWKKSGHILNVHGLLVAFITAVKVNMATEHIEMCLEVVSATPSDASPKLLNNAVKMLFSLLSYRTSLALDHIPQLLQQISHIISIISAASHVSAMEYPTAELVSVAYNIEKLAHVIANDNARHFARVAHFAVANLLHNFGEWTIEYSVKVHLKNALFSFMSLCDHHAISYLMRTLPPTPQFMFKEIHESYIKHHKFTGKV